MTENPLKYLNAKIDHTTKVSTQVENFSQIDLFIKYAKQLGYKVGLSLFYATDVNVVEKYIENIDFVQFVSVVPGAQHRPFHEEVLPKIKELKDAHPHFPIQVDGGVNETNIRQVLKSGADHVVIGSALFESENVEQKFKQLEALLI